MNITERYEKFLEYIMPIIDKKFHNQKEYLACSKGCALCCKNINIPFSDVEIEYLKTGFNKLNKEKRTVVTKKIKNVLDNKLPAECPFLLNEECSVYKYRGLICRLFGLLLVNESNEYVIPFCVHDGLNYSKVYDESTQKISVQKVKELGYKNDPIFYVISRQQIFDLKLAEELEVQPKDSKPLKEWLSDFI